MKYIDVVHFYEKIEATTKRLEMTSYLVDLFENTPSELIDKVVYMTQGRLYPDFVGIEIGMAEKMAYKALAMATGVSMSRIEQEAKKRGDIGIIAANLLGTTKKQTTLFSRELSVQDVYDSLDKIAKTTGYGSADTKMRILAGLLADASPTEAKYIMRTITGKMRLGIADMTILDALSQAFGEYKKDEIERVYNFSPDLGDIAKVLSLSGLHGIKEYHAKVGMPIKMMLAQRMGSADEIIEKMRKENLGRVICEYKYDGERIQIHKINKKVKLFSRNLENITEQYPDIVKFAIHNLRVEEAIVEGECVAVDADTGDMLAFQELMHRRRKYDIEEKVKEFPANIYLFDALLIEGEDITNLPLEKRRNILKESIVEGNGFKMSHAIVSENTKDIESFFESAIQDGCEGLVLKGENTIYQAGARGWSWIKLKRIFQSKIVEPIDVVIVGAFMGRGRRSGNYGALLVAVYDHERDAFPTISKLGSGFTDDELVSLPKMLSSYKLEKKHPRVESSMKADIWFEPKIVLEVIGDELTLSPIHPCGYNKIRETAGIAIRFPRFTHNFRWDKAAEDATTVEEIIDMYRSQLKSIGENKKF